MAIRTMIRGLVERHRAPASARPRRAGVALCAAILLLSTAAAADYAAGLTAFNRKEYARAFSEWIESAKAGDAHAQHGMGMLYEMGQGVPRADPKAAADWYQKAAAQNHAPALNNLARLHADGRGVQQDVPKAIELWSKAAEAGNVTARFNLGLQYASGSGVPQDMKKAAAYMLQAAEGGLPEAQFAVASYYRDGAGLEKDLDAARRWYDRAATAGFEPARTELAALDKPVASEAPEQTGPAQEQQTDASAQSQEQAAAPAEEAAEGEPADMPPTATEQAAAPADAPPQPDASLPSEPAAPVAKVEQPEESAADAPAGEEPPPTGAPEAPDPQPDLPVADSLTGDARVYRIWLYSSGQEGDARSYWDKLTIQYPRLLKELQLDLRRYFLGEAKGSLYRVFAGPFDSLGAAQKACEGIRQRSGNQFCRPVLN